MYEAAPMAMLVERQAVKHLTVTDAFWTLSLTIFTKELPLYLALQTKLTFAWSTISSTRNRIRPLAILHDKAEPL